MDGSLKQRLVGALVLVALAVLVIPVLLDNQREDALLASRIPQEPALGEVREIPLDLEQAHAQVVKEQQALVARVPAETAPEGEAPATHPASESAPASAPERSKAVETPAITSPTPVPVEPVQAPPTDVAVGNAPEPKPEPAAAPQPEVARVAKPAEGEGDAIGSFLRSAWVVQAGVFGNEANAKTLTAKLKASGFKAFTRKTPEGMRVFIGPELDRAKAQAMAPRVEIITKVKPRVVPFDPMQH